MAEANELGSTVDADPHKQQLIKSLSACHYA